MQMSSDMEENYHRSINLIRNAAEKGASLICFPEIQLSPFFPQYPDLEVDRFVLKPDSKYIRGIRDACQEHHIFAAPNFYVEEHGKRYDMSMLVDAQGQIIGRQKMVHIAQCDQFYEQSYYTPSEEGFSVFDTPIGRIGIVVCFDRHYPESIRTEALRGADLIVIPTANTTAEPSDLFQWEIRVQAFQNSVNIAMCNRVGREDEMEFSGESMIANYAGEAVAMASTEEELLIADIDLPGASKMRHKRPYTTLRRPNLYE